MSHPTLVGRQDPLSTNSSINTSISESTKFLGYDVKLEKVQTSNCCCGRSFPCEREAAAIRNKTVDDINNKDSAMVACRYLQCRTGEYGARCQAIEYGCYCNFFNQGVVQTRNAMRYKKTKRGCKTYLINELGLEYFKKIQELPYTTEGLEELKSILPKTCDMEKLDNKIERLRVKMIDGYELRKFIRRNRICS